MKTTQRSFYRRARLALFAGLAVLTAALAFTAALRFAEDSRDETVSDAPPSSEQAAEPPSQTIPSGVSEEAVQDAPKPTPVKTTQEALDPDLKRWMRLMRTQMELRGIQGEELEQRLEQRRSELAGMDASEREEHVRQSEFRVWEWNPHLSDRQNRIFQTLLEVTGSTRYPNEAPPELIEMLVEELDDLTAARNLEYPPQGWGWRPEREYAKIYIKRALIKNPISRDALLRKLDHTPLDDRPALARQLLELFPDDEKVFRSAAPTLTHNFPEEAIEVMGPRAPKDAHHWIHHQLGIAYERLDMIDNANYHYELGEKTSFRFMATHDDRNFLSIWEERAAAEAAKQLPPAESPALSPGAESPD